MTKPSPGRRNSLATAGVHAGGFLGPFGGGVTVAMLPELGADLGVSSATASATIPAYLVPFAVLMLFSGTLGARWGLRRSVLGAYGVSIAGSVLCVVAESFPVLLVGRGVQGVANAFTTPLLLATLAVSTPRARLGRTLGLFAAMQAAGQTSGPLLGGLAAEATWRLAFVAVAVTAAALVAIGLPADAARRSAEPVRLRAAWRPATLRTAVVAMIGWGCLGGLTFLVAFQVEDRFGLGASERGLLLTVFGVVGILTAGPVGRLLERIGARVGALVGAVVGAVPIALIGVVPWLPVLAVLWAVAGLLAQFLQVGVNALVLTGEANQAGAVSVVQAFRFAGTAAAPLALTPVYDASPSVAFLVPAVLLAIVPALALARYGRGEGWPA